MVNVPSNFTKSVCTHNFLCATFYQDSSVFGTTSMKNVQKHLGSNIYVSSKFSCESSPHGLCVRAHMHSLQITLAMATEYTNVSDNEL